MPTRSSGPFSKLTGLSAVISAGDLADRLAPPPSSIPSGFEAVLQFDPLILQRQLVANLSTADLVTLSTQIPYRPESVPASLRTAIEPYLPRFSVVFGKLDIEVRLVSPKLRTLRSTIPLPPSVDLPEDMVVVDPTIRSIGSSIGTPRGGTIGQLRRLVEIDWTLELNLVKRTPKPVLAGDTVRTATTTDFFTEERIPLAKGQVIAPARARSIVRSTLLQMWIELDFLGNRFVFRSDEELLQDFLNDELARDMLNQAVEPLLNATDVRLTPRIALAGQLSTSQIARLQLPDPRLNVLVLLHPDGREILTFCLNFGEDSEGAENLVQPFVGGRNFAYYVSERIFKPVLRERWKLNAALRRIEGDVPVEMRLSEDSDETGQGRARIRIQLAGEATDIKILASDSELGDPVKIVSEQTIQLLRLWDPRNHELTDLGELGEPGTEPFILRAQLFDDPPAELAGDSINPTFRKFATQLFLPIGIPMLEKIDFENVGGFTSSALKAILVRWDVKLPDLGFEVSVNPTNTVVVK